MFNRLRRIPRFGFCADIERNPAAASFQGMCPVPFIRKEVFNSTQQERTEPAPLLIGIAHIVLF
jgi:hypothetical protein